MSLEASSQETAGLDSRVERCRRVVDGLVEVGMSLVRTLDPARGAAPVRDPFQAYCRISRALRLTLVLEARLATLVEAGAPALADERRLAAQPAEATGTEGDAEEDLSDPPETAEAAERMGVERDRADADEVSRALSRPMGVIVAMVCRDFGLSNAEAGEAHAAFAELIANDDADDPGPGDADRAELGEPGGRPRRAARRAAGRTGRWPP